MRDRHTVAQKLNEVFSFIIVTKLYVTPEEERIEMLALLRILKNLNNHTVLLVPVTDHRLRTAESEWKRHRMK